MVVGEVLSVVYPFDRMMSLKKIDEKVKQDEIKTGEVKRTIKSRVMSNDEIFRRYGRPKYKPDEPNNSEMPGWTKGNY